MLLKSISLQLIQIILGEILSERIMITLTTIQEGSPIRLAEVDASAEKVLAKREGVSF